MELKKEYPLNNASIDEISDKVNEYLESLHTERKNQIRIRLLVEEILLDWLTRFSEEQAVCAVKLGKRFGHPQISLEVEGESFNPLDKMTEEYGAYRNRLLANMGLAPVYSYVHGCNRMVFRLKNQKTNPFLSLVLAIFTAVVLAIASPPIPGGTLTCYTIMFMQLGLPEEAIVVALALNVLFDFIATGINILCLELELILQAKRMELLDEKVLKRV